MEKAKGIQPKAVSGTKSGRRFKSQYQLYLMIFPALIFVTLFFYLPLSGWVMAFTDYKLGQNMFTAPWVGLKHFQRFFSGVDNAWYTVENTLVINLCSLFLGLVFACFLSLIHI